MPSKGYIKEGEVCTKNIQELFYSQRSDLISDQTENRQVLMFSTLNY